MKVRNLLVVLTTLFFSFAILVDCAHKKKTSDTNDEPNSDRDINDQEVNQLTASEKEEGWILLFDGRSLDGWRDFKGEMVGEGWTVEDGTMIALGQGGDLGGDIISVDQYESFILKLDWKISEGGNSGVFFHVLEEDYPTVYATGPEYQLIDDVGFPEKLEDWQVCGANYAMHPPVNVKLKPAGEWNSTEIVVDGPHVTHYLNGNKVVEYEMWTDEWTDLVNSGKWDDYPDYGLSKKGHLGLQDHGNKIWFRNIKIKEL